MFIFETAYDGSFSILLRLSNIEVIEVLILRAEPVLSFVGLKTTADWYWAIKDCFEMSLSELVFIGLLWRMIAPRPP